MSSLFGVPLDAAYHVISALVSFLTPVFGVLAAAAAIIAFTMVVRLLLVPLSYRAMRGLASQSRIAPQVQALRKKHADQPDRLQRERGRFCRSCTCCSGHRRSAASRTCC
jgi:YidC/Oxa1 family membrane protein insertase